MPDSFLDYLRSERERVDRALARVQAQRPGDRHEIAALLTQKRIVADQLSRWSREFEREAVAA